jgi:SAM-dependent methyltransferase
MSTPEDITLKFYHDLRQEVIEDNPYLDNAEQLKLQNHYAVMMNAKKYPPGLAATIYSNRRTPAVQAILEQQHPLVLDAGCGYGSESFLFAALGARVLAVDVSADQITIARKRKLYFEKLLAGRALDIDFQVADLNFYLPDRQNFSLTWIASMLAALSNQDDFLRRVYGATRAGGCVMVTDMNLLNPLFLFKEWRRRQRAKLTSPEFSRQADFWAMVRRRGRFGARFFPRDGQGWFDDVQFFSAVTLNALLRRAGFRTFQTLYSGFLPPSFYVNPFNSLETYIPRIPLLKELGYFYLVSGVK